jgi:hypothetical protein
MMPHRTHDEAAPSVDSDAPPDNAMLAHSPDGFITGVFFIGG